LVQAIYKIKSYDVNEGDRRQAREKEKAIAPLKKGSTGLWLLMQTIDVKVANNYCFITAASQLNVQNVGRHSVMCVLKRPSRAVLPVPNATKAHRH
jgi:hypothetical protein